MLHKYVNIIYEKKEKQIKKIICMCSAKCITLKKSLINIYLKNIEKTNKFQLLYILSKKL